ncbi:MAG: C-GCAxxG-C-C family protein [Armatimonadota bacterium]|nr:C-GCAxxG-C-C family protein [bacterium]
MSDRNAGSIALEHFKSKLNCAESVLLGVTEACGIKCNCAPRIATGFGGGVGGCGEICGALVGAVMALGLKFGRERGDDIESKSATGAKVDDLVDAFRKEFGVVRCIELTECDMRTPEGRQKAKELDLHGGLCQKFVEFAANEAAKLIGG